MRRDIGRHADGNAACPVHQQVGEAGRQDGRLLFRLVVVRLEIDGVLVDIRQQGFRRLGQPRLGIPHRRRRIVVERAEIALAGNQRQAHAEALGHTHQGVVDGGVAVRVELAHDVADDAG